ncbi:MAG: GtrA family protein [Clostridia bacterium]|nr:GtrA family protein [Clostridia bacterium]
MSKLFQQIIRFSIVGFICTVIDFALLYILKEFLDINVYLSTAIAFTVSVIVNYILSVLFVFDVDKSKNQSKGFILFVVFSVIGLILTEGIMHVGTQWLEFNYLIIKIFATLMVMVFNFVTRKLFLEKN